MKVLLAVPHKGDSINELKKILLQNDADLYIFPEGFLNTNILSEALNVIKSKEKYVISGFQDLFNNGQHKALVIDKGEIVDEYTKCILTKKEREKGKTHGERIFCVNTKFGKVGIPICYEIHFPEVSRIMSLENPVMLVNIIGTGMYHDIQLEQWTSLAKARAIENEVYVIGCSHFDGEIPLAYTFDPSGKCNLMKCKEYGAFEIEVDLEKRNEKIFDYFSDREPNLFGNIAR